MLALLSEHVRTRMNLETFCVPFEDFTSTLGSISGLMWLRSQTALILSLPCDMCYHDVDVSTNARRRCELFQSEHETTLAGCFQGICGHTSQGQTGFVGVIFQFAAKV